MPTARRVTARPITARRITARPIQVSGTPAPTPFTPSDLFGESDYGDWWDFRTADGLFIADDGATDPVSENDPVGSAVGRRGQMIVTQATTGNKPIWQGNFITRLAAAGSGESTLSGGTPSGAARDANSNGFSLFSVGQIGSFVDPLSSQGHMFTLSSGTYQGRRRPDSVVVQWGSGTTLTPSADIVPFAENIFGCLYGPPTGEGDVLFVGSAVPTPLVVPRGTSQLGETFKISSPRYFEDEGPSVGGVYITRALTSEEIEKLRVYYGAAE